MPVRRKIKGGFKHADLDNTIFWNDEEYILIPDLIADNIDIMQYDETNIETILITDPITTDIIPRYKAVLINDLIFDIYSAYEYYIKNRKSADIYNRTGSTYAITTEQKTIIEEYKKHIDLFEDYFRDSRIYYDDDVKMLAFKHNISKGDIILLKDNKAVYVKENLEGAIDFISLDYSLQNILSLTLKGYTSIEGTMNMKSTKTMAIPLDEVIGYVLRREKDKTAEFDSIDCVIEPVITYNNALEFRYGSKMEYDKVSQRVKFNEDIQENDIILISLNKITNALYSAEFYRKNEWHSEIYCKKRNKTISVKTDKIRGYLHYDKQRDRLLYDYWKNVIQDRKSIASVL